jgi:hypothetical protein
MNGSDRRITIVAIVLLGFVIGGIRLAGVSVQQMLKPVLKKTDGDRGASSGGLVPDSWNGESARTASNSSASDLSSEKLFKRLAKVRPNMYVRVRAFDINAPLQLPQNLAPEDRLNNPEAIEAFYDLGKADELYLPPSLPYGGQATFGTSAVMPIASNILFEVSRKMQEGDLNDASTTMARVTVVSNTLIASANTDLVAMGLAIKELQQHVLAQGLQFGIDDPKMVDFVDRELSKTTEIGPIQWSKLIDYEIARVKRSQGTIRNSPQSVTAADYRKQGEKVKSIYNDLSFDDVKSLLYVEERIDFSSRGGYEKRVLGRYDLAKSIAVIKIRGSLVMQGIQAVRYRQSHQQWPNTIDVGMAPVPVTMSLTDGVFVLNSNWYRMRSSNALSGYMMLALPDADNQQEPLTLTIFQEKWERTCQRVLYTSPLSVGNGQFMPTK